MTSSMCEYEVIVQLKKEVLDPEGRAIQETLARLGQECVKSVVVSKRFVLDIDPSKTKKNSEDVVREIAREFLANPVSQTVTVKKLKSGDM
jgi:phosphoribosylformylglycinamidine synthase PurS subunit